MKYWKNQYQLRLFKQNISKLSPEEQGKLLIQMYKDSATIKQLMAAFSSTEHDIINYLKLIDIKRCTQCGSFKSFSDFHIAKDKTSGYQNHCKECAHKKRKTYYENNKQDSIQKSIEWKSNNKDRVSELRKIQNSKSEQKEKNRNYVKQRRHNDPRFKLRANFSNLLSYHISKTSHTCLRKRERSWENIVGYTLDDLRKNLESKFQEGMTWENYGDWHIDHILPDSSFSYTSFEDDEFKKCWSLNNLQPLWAKDNLTKSNKIIE